MYTPIRYFDITLKSANFDRMFWYIFEECKSYVEDFNILLKSVKLSRIF